MKFATTLAAASSLAASAYAAPAVRSDVARKANETAPTLNSTVSLASNGETYGAAYCEWNCIVVLLLPLLIMASVITNDPTGNYIVAANINADGSLTLANAMSAGGLGQHGNVTGADPLYSQGAVVVHSNSSLLATVNVCTSRIPVLSAVY